LKLEEIKEMEERKEIREMKEISLSPHLPIFLF
jgi:hypothetical protein